VLLREDRRRYEDRDLLPVLHGLERGAQRDLGLAVADIADDEAVHRAAALHVLLRVLDGQQLVRRLGVRERVLHLDLPRCVTAERVRMHRLARGVELQELARDVLDRLLRLPLRRGPLTSAERRERGRRATDVAGHAVDALGRQRDDVGAGEPQLEVLANDTGDLLRGEPLEPRDAVLLVHDVIARLQVREERADRDAPAAPLGMPRLAEAEDLGVGEDAQAKLRDGEAFRKRYARELERSRHRWLGDRVVRRRRDAAVREKLRETRGLRRRDETDVAVVRRATGDLAE